MSGLGGSGGRTTEGDGWVAERLFAQQTATLYGKGPIPYLANIVNGTILVAAMGGSVSVPRRVGWLGVLTALTLVRMFVGRMFHRRPALLSSRAWARLFAVGLGLGGAIWGSAALLFWTSSTVERALIAFVLGGMVAGASATTPSYMPAFYAFVATALSPAIVRLLAAGKAVEGAMGVMLTFFGLAMTALACAASRAFVQNTKLRLRNADLVDRLTEARDALERRVAERTAELQHTVVRLERAEGNAQQALHVRNEFLAVASHELRTPVTSLALHVGSLERSLTRDEPPDLPRIRARVAGAHRQVRRLIGLVDTVMAASGLARNGPALKLQDVDLFPLVSGVVEDLSGVEPGAPVLRFETPLRTLMGRWDPVRVEQVITNLVSNAIKYGGGKPITVSLARDNRTAIVVVRDEGPGIAGGAVDRVFDRFFRADAGGQSGGMGLGLSVVRELVLAMGGTVTVASEPGAGATFSVRLPGAYAVHGEAERPPADPTTR